MRFLVDRCAGRRLAEWLRTQEHDVVESRERGPDPGDRTLLAWASAEERVLITMDKDFGGLIFLGGASHCGLVRLPDVPAARRIELMHQLLQEHRAALETGAVLTVRGDRVRISRARG